MMYEHYLIIHWILKKPNKIDDIKSLKYYNASKTKVHVEM